MHPAHRGFSDAGHYRGSLRRYGLPFVTITVIAFALSILSAEDPKHVLFFCGWGVAVVGLGLAWLQPKLWVAAPFGALGGALLVRAGADGLDAGIGPLLLIPILAMAVYGSRKALMLMIGVILTAIFVVHLLIVDGDVQMTSTWRQDLILIVLATVLGIVIQDLVTHMRRERNLAEERGEMIESLSEVTRRIATSRNAGKTLCAVAVEETPATGVALFSFDGDYTGLVATEGGRADLLEEMATASILRGDGVSEARYRDGDEGMEYLSLPFEALEPDLIICQPVTAEKRVVGSLLLAYSGTEPGDGIPVTLLAAEASIAIRHHQVTEQLDHLATTDPLTGIDNRRGWERMIQRNLGQARRHKRPLCLAMLDLDRFKAYNDAHGHQAGDDFLRRTAATWEAMIRVDDHIARYGGEEFVLTLPNTRLEGGKAIVDRLRESLPETGDPDHQPTCSAGIAEWDGSETVRELVARADQALYHAKEAGRNQTVSLDSSASFEHPADPAGNVDGPSGTAEESLSEEASAD